MGDRTFDQFYDRYFHVFQHSRGAMRDLHMIKIEYNLKNVKLRLIYARWAHMCDEQNCSL